ncbi:hypothetical protein FI667_g17388, partial [Globisporangium splendens]
MPSPTATSTQEELQASATSYAREILEFDRPTAVPRDQWDGKVESHLVSRFFDLPDWFAREVSQVERHRTVTKYREETRNGLSNLDTGLRVFAGIMSLGTTEIAGVAATSTEHASNRDEIQQVEVLLQRIEERIAQLEQSSARHEQFEHLRREFRQQVEQDQLASQQVRNVVTELRARMDDMEQMQRDGVVINDEDFDRWAGTPMRAV